MSTEQQIQMAAKLYSARDTVRRLWADDWREMIRDQTQVIMTLMEREHCNEIEAMIKACQKAMEQGHDAHTAILFMAACVEMVEPSDPLTKQKMVFLRKEYQEYQRNGGKHRFPAFYRRYITFYTWDSVLADEKSVTA